MHDDVIDRLRHLHRRLDEEIVAERKRRTPDDWRLARLKKTKLAIKDRLVDRHPAYA